MALNLNDNRGANLEHRCDAALHALTSVVLRDFLQHLFQLFNQKKDRGIYNRWNELFVQKHRRRISEYADQLGFVAVDGYRIAHCCQLHETSSCV